VVRQCTFAAVPPAAAAVSLESPLPQTLPEGTSATLFCSGTASVSGRPVAALELLVDGVERGAGAFAMPRFDMPCRRSGFWSVIDVVAGVAGSSIAIGARVRGADMLVVEIELGRIEVTAGRSGPPAPKQAARAEGLIAVCLASYEAPEQLLRAQLDSLRGQSDPNWCCVVSDDCSSEEGYARLLDLIAEDPRFVVSRSEQRIGFYRNFERALAMVPPDATLVALCDQDDRWHPDKLTTLRAAIGSAQLVYSDQRLVDADGRVLRETLWHGRANNATSIASMLIANTVTGAAALIRADLAHRALPFPDSPGIEFHDHWLALMALAEGEVRYVDRSLYDYVQHRGAILGKVLGDDASAGRDRWSKLRMREWRAAYFLGYVPGQIRARTLLVRCGAQLTPSKRRALERYVAADRSVLALLWLLARPLRLLAGRTETLGGEWEIAGGLLWRRLAALLAWLPGWPERLLLDCRFPDPPRWRQRRLERWRSRI
jgi:glycosyltransferase involved in cell wall biosynthesis